jgi:putative aldouronate transport system permease protein
MMKVRDSRDTAAFKALGVVIILAATALSLFPFLLMISGSLSTNESIAQKGYALVPRDFSTSAYEFIFRYPDDIVHAYCVTIGVTVIGTLCGLFLISMAGYALQRQDFRVRRKISFYIFFTTLFQGGLIPWYIVIVNFLKLKNSYAVLVFNMIMSPFLILLMRNFIQASVPQEITESAKIDGANDFRIYRTIVLPVCAPALATVGLFLALGYWNDWFNCGLFIDDRSMFNLQYFLYNTLTASQYLAQMAASSSLSLNIPVPGETAKLAMSLVAMGPVIFVYPFIQKYFVSGITVGAIKG